MMAWLTINSNRTLWHINMELVETVKVQFAQREDGFPDNPPKPQSIDLFFKGDEEPSLQFTAEEDEIEAVAKAVHDFMGKKKA